MVAAVMLSKGHLVEEVDAHVSWAASVNKWTLHWQQHRVDGVCLPHSPFVMFELGSWCETVSDSDLIVLPPTLASKLLVAPVLLLARSASGGVEPLTAATYMSLLQRGNAVMAEMHQRMMRMSQPSQFSSLEDLGRKSKRTAGSKLAKVGTPTKAAKEKELSGRRKAKCKDVSEEDEDSQDDACELGEEEDEEEEEEDEDGELNECDDDELVEQDEGDDGDELDECEPELEEDEDGEDGCSDDGRLDEDGSEDEDDDDEPSTVVNASPVPVPGGDGGKPRARKKARGSS